MRLNDFKRLIAPLKKKISLLAGRAILSAVDNSGGIQKLMITALYNETINNVERFQEYGFETYPFADSEPFAIFLNGNRDHGFILCVHDRRYRPTDLVEGEVALYTDEDATTEFRLQLKRNRIAYLRSDKLQIISDTDAYINSPEITFGGAVFAAARELIDDRFTALFNNHVHSQANDSDGDVQVNTDAPTTTLGAGHRTSKTRAL